MSAAQPGPPRSEDLLLRLVDYPDARRYLVGFSGGADSTALLTALHRRRDHLDADFEAVHFDHGLHPDSALWRQHCETFCRERGIVCWSYALDLSADQPNLEGRARELRYRRIENLIDSKTIYLTAHHSGDCAETMLLHALRGSGIDGLASIPEIRPLGAGLVARPLLRYSRDALAAYLRNLGVKWIEDPSNRDAGMDRNFIRREILPRLEQRWPSAGTNLARSAKHLSAANRVLGELLRRHLESHGAGPETLPRRALLSLGDDAAALLLRQWLRDRDIPAPPRARMEEFLDQVSNAGAQAHCEVAWAGVSLRLFKDALQLVSAEECVECPVMKWESGRTIALGTGLGEIRLSAPGEKPSGWVIGPRKAGETIRLHQAGPRRKLKKIMQEHPIPPWQRMSIPVLYWDGRAVAIGDWLYAPEFADWLRDQGREYHWYPEREDLKRTQARCHAFQAHRANA